LSSGLWEEFSGLKAGFFPVKEFVVNIVVMPSAAKAEFFKNSPLFMGFFGFLNL
jgi:hypothetical protein